MHSLQNQQNFSEEEKKGDTSTKLDQVKYDYSNAKKSYNKLGSAGIEGSLYQINLLTMFLLNGLRKVENWRLSTEDKRAAQLDDLIFEYLPSESAILLQAKHKEDEKKAVTFKDFMSVDKKSEFSLPKYFFSYQEVKNKFKVQSVVICTNLKVDKKTKGVLKEERVDPGSVLHFEGAENICFGFSGCSLPKLKQNIKKYHAKNMKKKKVIICDEDINDFLQHLKFFPNCLGDKNVETIVHQTISEMKFSENLTSETIQTYIQKNMIDWFKEKKGRYLTEVEAKAFFCDMRSNKYCEHLKLYDISFKNNNLPVILQTQQRNENVEKDRQQNENDAPAKDPKQVSHIIPDEEYMLNVVKIYQAVPPRHKEKALFVNPEETIEAQRQIIDAFEVPRYTILVMVCPSTIEETTAQEMCDKVMKVLDNHKYKHVILIAEEKNYLATQFKRASYYEVISDSITFADLEETTRKKFKRKKLINFQGCTVSLEELFTPSSDDDLNQTVTSEMLIKLARGDKSEVGRELPHPDNYYISRSFNRNGQNILEEDLWRSTEASEEKVILISDSAGMGKSCVLTSLAISIKRANPHLWVVRFDLSNYTNIMKTTLAEGRESVSIIEMLNSQETSEVKGEFGKKLFTTPKRVVLMLDGMDEISPTYTALVKNLIRDSLVLANLAKIFVTTRPHMSKILGEIPELQSFTFELLSRNRHKKIPKLKLFTLQPFSRDNQRVFLTKYWAETLDLQDDARKSKCNIFAGALIENISVWLNEEGRSNFAGIPLQTRMLAEIFRERNKIRGDEHDWEGCKGFLSSNNEEPKLPARIDLTQLYKLFIDKKRDVFIKNDNPSCHPLIDDLLKNQFEECVQFHYRMALEVIFDSDKLHLFTWYTNNECPIPSPFQNNFLLRLGIVQRQGERIEFLHRTFAEYFAADCLLIELEREPVNEEFQQFFIRSILLEREFYVIRAFLDSRMRNVFRLMERSFCNYFRRNRISEESLTRYFQVFAEEGCARFFVSFIECIGKEQREILSTQVNKLSIMYKPLLSVTQYGHLNILKLLLELNETFNKGKDAHKHFLAFVVIYAVQFNLRTFKFLSRHVDESDTHVLGCSDHHEAVLMGRFGKVELWVEKTGADINAKDNSRGCTAFQGAVSMSLLEVVKLLVDEGGADTNVKDNDGVTAFHAAVYGGKLEVVAYLVKEARVDVNVKCNKGVTALHTAAYGGKLEIVKYLIEEAGADINVKEDEDDGATVLHKATLGRELEVVKYLIEEAGADINVKCNNGLTALHSAAYGGKLEIVRYLVKEARVDINAKSNDGVTTLQQVAYGGNLEIVKYLIEAGADINVKDDEGNTALHKAAYEGKLEVVKYLVEEAGADPNDESNDGVTALHAAAYGGKLEIVKYLMEEAGAHVNVKCNNGLTALHQVAHRGKLEIVKYLIVEAGVDINVKDDEGGTALHIAAYGGKLEVVKYLIEETGADTNVKCNNGLTALHSAAYGGKLEIVKYLIEEAGADINAKCNNGFTALHAVAYGSNLEIVKYLMEEAGADINVKCNNGMTALHQVAYEGKLEIVKYLIVDAGADINVKDVEGGTPLHKAAYGGKLEVVKYLIEAGADINVKDDEGGTALHRAAYGDKLEIVKYLIEEAGADINAKLNDGVTVLHQVAYGGKLEIVKYLIEEAGADINAKDDKGHTVLYKAAHGGELDVVKYLMEEAGADINVKSNIGVTALHQVAYGGTLEIVKYLIEEAEVDINVKDVEGGTALHKAAYGGKLEIVKYLVEEAGADINVKDDKGDTVFYKAAHGGQLEVVKYLMEEAGADINVKSNNGVTALHQVAHGGKLEIVKYLIVEAGADLNVRDEAGGTALHQAALGGQLEVVKYLMEEVGVDINVIDNCGSTALYYAAYGGKLEIVKYLMEEAGADVNVKCDNGVTALHAAAFRGKLETVRYLIVEAGADINVRDDEGDTVLHKAALGGELDVVKYLIEVGADINVTNNQGRTALR